MARSLYRFTCAALPDHVRDRLCGTKDPLGGFQPAEIPGVFCKGRTLFAPLNAAWLLDSALKSAGLDFTVAAPRARTLVKWRDVVEATRGELREWVPDFLCDYQKIGVLTVLRDPDESGALHWPTGAGKTIGAIVWSVFHPGPIVFVTKAAARRTIQREFQRYTTIEPIVLLPKSELRAKDPDPAEQIAALVEAGAPPRAVIVGWETVPLFLPTLLSLHPTSLVLDELHRASNHRRFAKVAQAAESQTEKPEFRRLNNIVAAVARLSSNVTRRLGATATPIPDRRRNLWSQLDMIHPGAWGPAWNFFYRYCNVTTTNHGNLDNSGRSNTEELERRLCFVRHKVDSAVTRAALPPLRRQVLYIQKAQQAAPIKSDGWAKELARAQKIGRRAIVEVKLAEAATRKRPVILEWVKDALAGEGTQGKIIIFTGRHNDCDRLDAALEKALPNVQRWMGHGGHGVAHRDQIRDAFMAHPGPCVLIGTGASFGEAYNLQDADVLIQAQLPINGKELLQCEGRVSRHGQKRPVLILYPVAEGSIDERLKSILLDKLPDVADLQQDSNFETAFADLQSSGLTDAQIMLDLFAKVVGDNAGEGNDT